MASIIKMQLTHVWPLLLCYWCR